jgi:hypothetical protein
MDVLDRINEWNFEIKTWLILGMVLFKSMNQQSVIFWNDNNETKKGSIIVTNSFGNGSTSLSEHGKISCLICQNQILSIKLSTQHI